MVAGAAGAAMVVAGLSLVRSQTHAAAAAERTPRPVFLATPLLSLRRAPGAVVDAVARSNLERAMRAAIAGPLACAAVHVDGRLVASIDVGRALTPASTMKVLTALTLLEQRAGNFRFATSVHVVDPVPGDGVIAGDLSLVGGGDPTLATPRYEEYVRSTARFASDPLTPLQGLVDALRDAGVRRIEGAVVGDGSRYSDVTYLDTWKPNYRTEGQVGPIGALTVNHGFADFAPPRPVDDPARYAAEQLTVLLERSGIDVAGDARAGRVDGADEEIATIRSPRLVDIVAGMLTSSDNTTAEMLLREAAVASRRGNDTATGAAVLRSTLEARGVGLDDATILDGSGLSAGDRLTCRTLIDAITIADPTVDDGLADAGESGTLATRFVGHVLQGRLHAKTGQLSGVVGFVGVIDGVDGRPAVRFAFLANGNFGTAEGQAFQQRVAEAAATYPEAPDGSTLVPPPVSRPVSLPAPLSGATR